MFWVRIRINSLCRVKNSSLKYIDGVGGFGKVYIGSLEDGTKVAIKRGNPGSEQVLLATFGGLL